jgi:hypothetical protein
VILSIIGRRQANIDKEENEIETQPPSIYNSDVHLMLMCGK